jgi:alkylhydroperoxidase/carboxymuconolactone decarboxylase family protein YurZ
MSTTDQPSDLPGAAGDVARGHPELWDAFQQLGRQVRDAGPLTERERRLVGLAFAIAVGSEGGTHSHARRGAAEGLTAPELEHVALLAMTTLGWPQAIKGLTWIRDVTRETEQE